MRCFPLRLVAGALLALPPATPAQIVEDPVYHIAVVFDPPHEDRSFEKLEIYEVRNGKIVTEYDGQLVAGGRATAGGLR